MTNSNLTVHNEKNFTFFLVSLFWPLIFSEIIVKMAKKISIEIKASLLRHYFAENARIESFVSKKGYAHKRIRGSKGLIPKADIESCRTEIRQKTQRYSPINIDESGITKVVLLWRKIFVPIGRTGWFINGSTGIQY